MADKPSRWPAFLTRNKAQKLAALFLALVAWYAIQAAISFETVVTDIPLTVRLDEGWAVLESSAKTIDVVFRGSQEDTRYLSRDQVRIEIDLRGHAAKGSSTVKLDARNVYAPSAVRPILLRPSIVTLRLDQEGEKQVPVKVDLQGVLPEGYDVEKVVCNPASVVMHGPRLRLNDIELVRTMPLDLEGRSRSFKKMKLGLVQPSDAWVARLSPSNVEVEVSVVEQSSTKEVSDVPLTVLVQPGPRPRLDVSPAKVNVVVKGRAEILRNLQPADVQAFVDCSALPPGASYDLPVHVNVLQGLTAITVEPQTVKVTMGEL